MHNHIQSVHLFGDKHQQMETHFVEFIQSCWQFYCSISTTAPCLCHCTWSILSIFLHVPNCHSWSRISRKWSFLCCIFSEQWRGYLTTCFGWYVRFLQQQSKTTFRCKSLWWTTDEQHQMEYAEMVLILLYANELRGHIWHPKWAYMSNDNYTHQNIIDYL